MKPTVAEVKTYITPLICVGIIKVTTTDDMKKTRNISYQWLWMLWNPGVSVILIALYATKHFLVS